MHDGGVALCRATPQRYIRPQSFADPHLFPPIAGFPADDTADRRSPLSQHAPDSPSSGRVLGAARPDAGRSARWHHPAAAGQLRHEELRLRDDRPQLGRGPGRTALSDARRAPRRPPLAALARISLFRLSHGRAVEGLWRIARRLGPGDRRCLQCRLGGPDVPLRPPPSRAVGRHGRSPRDGPRAGRVSSTAKASCSRPRWCSSRWPPSARPIAGTPRAARGGCSRWGSRPPRCG